MKNNIIDREIELIVSSTLIAVVRYKIDEDIDDYIQEEVRKAWEDKSYLWLDAQYDDCEIYVGGKLVNEIDMSKVLAINWL